MQALGTSLIMFGIGIAVLAQIAAAILTFRASVLKGVLSLIVPGYMFFALYRQGTYAYVVGAWSLGILGLVAGTVILS
jgi:hypothetical protein